MASMEPTFSKKLNKHTIRRGLLIFFVLTFVGLVINFLWWENKNVRTVLATAQWPYLVVIVGLMGVDWFLGTYRLYIFGKPMVPQTKVGDYFRANLANIFMGGVTPSQTGGGPAQIYVLHRAGVPLSIALALSVINLFSTMLLFFVSAWLTIFFNPHIYPASLLRFIQYGFWTFGTAILVFGLTVFRPEWCLRVLQGIPKGLQPISRWAADVVDHLLSHLDKALHAYKEQLLYFFTKSPTIVLKSLVATALLYLNKFTIAYFIVRMLGGSVPFWHLVFVQIIQFFIIYFAPTPGSGGVAEVSSSLLMSALISEQDIPYFALLWRLFTLYIPLLVGGIIIMRQLNRDLEAHAPVWKEGKSL